MIKEYRDCYCLFLDILGFKDIVEASAQAESGTVPRASQIYFSLKKIARSLNYKSVIVGRSGLKFRSSRVVTQFSDSVVVSYAAKEVDGLAEMLYDVLHLQLALVRRKLLVRGSIARGLLHHDRDFVFGPALIEAAELERLAMYPRVIVTQELLEKAKILKRGGPSSHADLQRSAKSLVTRDLDGVYFVDYFSVRPDDFDGDWSEVAEYLIYLRELVGSLAVFRQPSLRLKHSWLRQKYNEIAEPLEKSGFRRLGEGYVPDDEEDHFRGIRPFR